jgi:hypothetical protein
MSARLLVWMLNATLLVAVLVFAAAAVITLGAPLLGEPLLSTWPIAVSAVDLPLATGGRASLNLDQGHLQLEGTDVWLLLLKLVDLGATAALALTFLTLLRRFAVEVSADRPFEAHAALRLRWIGGLLIAWPLWQAVHLALAQLWLLYRADVVTPGLTLLHSMSKEPLAPGVVRLLLDVDASFAIAGLVLLVVAQAFRVGVAQRRELEEIV